MTMIGLEIHCQLTKLESKLFCSCKADYREFEPNTNICPICMGIPGSLPLLNKKAVEKATLIAMALDCDTPPQIAFFRKNYFYPDSPSAYQISQLYQPIVENGFIELDSGKKVKIDRAHLEADAGKNIHDGDISKVDLNRAGTPLLEIVSEPDMRSSEEAILYLKKLHAIVRYLGISDANMQEGSFRVDVNVSVRQKGQEEFGTRVEIKNLNSFRHIAKAIAYEVERHIEAIEDGTYEEEVYLETRLFDTRKNETRSMRSKEDAHDYRYFPDPDLLPLELKNDFIEKIKSEIPELPDEKKKRFIQICKRVR